MDPFSYMTLMSFWLTDLLLNCIHHYNVIKEFRKCIFFSLKFKCFIIFDFLNATTNEVFLYKVICCLLTFQLV